ncbi:MAG TPA: DUF4180 domain-containing protein [Spirochaetia bacterium]|nr:DUF4180 domain-containing protein [Spirochaetia bacterium]
MTQKVVETSKGMITVFDEIEPPIGNVSDFLDIIANTAGEAFAVTKESLSHDFYDLKTRLAGELLQKVSTYNKHMIILGDFSTITSKSLRDFIYESNKTGEIVFASSLDDGVCKLR